VKELYVQHVVRREVREDTAKREGQKVTADCPARRN
jgi:hypothetical protein